MTPTMLAPAPASATASRAHPEPATAPDRPLAAVAVVVLAGLNVGAVCAVAEHGARGLAGGPAAALTFAGRVTGLFAELFVVGQLLLAARVPALERRIGHDILLRWHRGLGQVTLVAVLAHPLLLAAGYGASVTGFLHESVDLATTMVQASLGALLIVLAAATSVGLARRRLPYELWYLVHLATYAAVFLAFGHQLAEGNDLAGSRVIAWWWKGQLVLAAACLVTFRLALPLIRSARHGVRIADVVAESPYAVSIYLTGRRLDRLGAVGGQFFVWRFLSLSTWWEAHPFSLSAAPGRDAMRITVGLVGEGSRKLAALKPGTRVVFEGPYGTFTEDRRTRGKVLLIGAGLGVAPLRALLEELPPTVHVVLLHRVGQPDQAVLTHEFGPSIQARGGLAYLIAGPRGDRRDPGRPLGPDHLKHLVPDIRRREVYLCGPPGFCADVTASLRRIGVSAGRVHHERFAL